MNYIDELIEELHSDQPAVCVAAMKNLKTIGNYSAGL